MAAPLTQSQLDGALTHLPDWRQENGEIIRITTFPTFQQAIAFVNQVADIAEDAYHHPDIDIRYNKVRLALVTHDANGITQKDINLAMEIDRELQKSCESR